MNIVYKDTKHFTAIQLERLFLSVEWASGYFPNKLTIALRNFDTVYSAWDGDKLVGLVGALDDGIMNAYVQYLLVDPAYFGNDIGKTLVSKIKQKYVNYMRIAIIAYNEEVDFYEKCGFVKNDGASPLFISALWD